MARINIDDEVWLDPRITMLQKEIGENEALGILIRFWKIAQLYWGKDELIPIGVFNFHCLSDALFKHGLAERRGDFVYAKGSETYFDWYLQKCRNGKFGSLGGRPMKNKHLGNPELTHSNPELTHSKPEITPPVPVPVPVPVPDTNTCQQSPVDAHALFSIWNETPGVSKTRGTNKKRNKLVAERWKENPSEEYWVEVADKIAASSFCLGKSETGWKATFDWFIHPDTHLKVLEGKYDDAKSQQKIRII